MDNKVFFADDTTVDKEVTKLKENGFEVELHFFDFGITIDYDENHLVRTHINFQDGIAMTVIHIFPILGEAIVSVFCGNAWQKGVDNYFKYYDKLGLE